jgi:hypothetical protein
VTLSFLSKAILFVMTAYPFGNATVLAKIEAFARALPRLAPAQAELARTYVTTKLGIAEGSPIREALIEATYLLDDPNRFNARRCLSDLACAPRFSNKVAGVEEAEKGRAWLLLRFEEFIPK